MVHTTSENYPRETTITSTGRKNYLPPIQPGQASSIRKKSQHDVMSVIRSALQNQRVSQPAHARIHTQLLETWNP